MAFSEADNIRALRTTYRTVSNLQFPCVYDEESGFGNSTSEFMDKILKCTVKKSSGTIELPDDVSLSRSARTRTVMDNPVAYVIESKTVINDICSLLIGAPAQDFFPIMTVNQAEKHSSTGLKRGSLGTVCPTLVLWKIMPGEPCTITSYFFVAFLHMF
jgi:hypothetical protein